MTGTAQRRAGPPAIGVLGAGAFGTALAMTLAAAGQPVVLWGRDAARMAGMAATRQNAAHLPGIRFPDTLTVSAAIPEAIRPGAPLLLAVPTQALRGFVAEHRAALQGHMLVLCCKGIELGTGLLPSQVVAAELPGARVAVLSGPSFAADLAIGKPTALTLATLDPAGPEVQDRLSTPALRIYLGADPLGAQLGGALKNVIAIAAGVVMGAGLGESARAALVTRGFAELLRLAMARGARQDTLFGLSGFGDLMLTCFSATSRNYSLGLALGAGIPPATGVTVEGAATARAVAAATPGQDLPVLHMVAALLRGDVAPAEAMGQLMSRPQKREGWQD